METEKIAEIARVWLEAYRDDSKLLSDEKALEIHDCLNLILDGPEEDFWNFFDEIARGVETDFQVANFGCGPLETYLNTRTVRMDFVAERASRGGRYVEMLALIDLSEINNDALKTLLGTLSGIHSRRDNR